TEGLERLGVRVEAAVRDGPTRRAFTFIDANGERTITTIGERLAPSADDPLRWSDLAATDAVYLTAGDRGAMAAARRARVVVATARILRDLAAAHLELDALVGSARDPSERYEEGALMPPPRLVVLTEGRDGGTYRTAEGRSGRFPATPPPGPLVDTYGAGDSFAAGLAYGLAAERDDLSAALDVASRCGAEATTRRGAHGA
ncbi:MAG TPA: PfkB family carbohydrate kinase, partial [Actinomycetota bacterium]|nr:PfkB family carbohydrate kinase [Actinomycetota bacterium]